MPENKIDEVDIVNFAINLEHLEAEFYTYATTGKACRDTGEHREQSLHGFTVTGARVGRAQPTVRSTSDGGYHALHQAITQAQSKRNEECAGATTGTAVSRV
jgi:hypothetical protein